MNVPTSEASLKDYLSSNDNMYRKLAAEHLQYEERLNELSNISHLNPDEQMEEVVLKKKKLLIKDQMEHIAVKYKSEISGH